MTVIRIDPALPGVDIDETRCPGCGQTLAVVLDGVAGLPPLHYPRPTRISGGPRAGRVSVRVDARNVVERFCPVSGDDLARAVFIAQREAAT